MKRAPRSRQRHDLYAKYHDYDSEISDLLGECGIQYLGLQIRADLTAVHSYLSMIESGKHRQSMLKKRKRS